MNSVIKLTEFVTANLECVLNRSVCSWQPVVIYRVYQNDWSGLEADYIHKYGEETYKY